MKENKRVLGSNLKKIDAHEITLEEYEDIPELTDEWFENATPMIGGKRVSREEWKVSVQEATKCGRPKSATPKCLLTVRYSPEVVEYFQASGPGWQARMDEALKEWIKSHAA